jgi:hypothetical protein
MNYKIVTSGTTKKVTLDNISHNLGISSEVYALSDGETYLGMISRQTLVLFATEFADYALKNYAKKIIPEAETCIRLARKWLEDRESVSNEELRTAAAAAAAADAADATDAAAWAAYAAYAADAAANAAANAAAWAAYAAGMGREEEYIRQGKFILDFLRSGNHLFLV